MIKNKFNKYHYHKLATIVAVLLCLLFITRNAVYVFVYKYEFYYPYLLELSILFFALLIYRRYLHKTEKTNSPINDCNSVVLIMLFVQGEFISQVLQVYFYKEPLSLNTFVTPYEIIMVLPLINLRKMSSHFKVTSLVTIQFLFFYFFLDVGWFQIFAFFVSVCINAMSFLTKRHNAIKLVNILRNNTKKQREFGFKNRELTALQGRCLYLSALADSINSPMLVLHNCVQILKNRLNTDTNVGEGAQILATNFNTLETEANKMLNFTKWLSEIREQNSSFKNEKKIRFETTKLLNSYYGSSNSSNQSNSGM